MAGDMDLKILVTCLMKTFYEECVMKKIFAVLAIVCLFVPSAFAQTTIGVGWDDGYSIKLPLDPVTLQLTGRFDSVVPEDDNIDTETDVEIAAYVSYPFLAVSDSKLGLFGGVSLMPTTREITVAGKSYDKELDFGFRFGFEPETRISDNIGISAKLGLEIEVDQGYDGLDDSGNTNVGSWGSIGVHWFF